MVARVKSGWTANIKGNGNVGAYWRCWEFKKGRTPQRQELRSVHAVLNRVLLLLLHPTHVDNLEGKHARF